MEKSVTQVPGVMCADLNFATGMLVVDYDPELRPLDAVMAVVRRAGHGLDTVAAMGAIAPVAADGESTEPPPPTWWQTHGHAASVAVSAALLVIGWALSLPASPAARAVAAVLWLAAVPIGGVYVARRALASIRARLLDMNVLMSLAVIGAVGIGAFEESAAIIVLFSLGQLLEARALERTRRSIRDLMALAPARARVRRDGHEVEIDPGAARVGDMLLVKPGERIALDGVVRKGASAVDEAAITGESVPVEKQVGATVWAGTLNASGLLEVEVTSAAADSTLARIVYLVEEAQAQRAPAQRLVDRFTRWYTPAVVALAALLAVAPPLLGLGTWAEWFYRALVVLVVSCPCALVISTPVAIVSAITRATRDGVLVKGGAFLEVAPTIRVIAFDKTGTLTCGRPEVTDVVPLGGHEASDVLRLAAALEAGSTHPVAEAVLRAEGGGGGVGDLEDFEDVAGRGVRARIGGVVHSIGSPTLAAAEGSLTADALRRIAALEDAGKTVLVLAQEGTAVGLIGVADDVRPEAPEVIERLRRLGIKHVIMLTGDNERTAAAVAVHAGVTEVRARLLPEDKVDAVAELKRRYGPVAMVGDGVNDAPALAAADLGIAMGAAGSDTALETADIALLAPDLRALPGLFSLGRRTVANIRANVVFSIVTKVVVLALAVLGVASLWLAVFADMGVSLLVTANGLRLLRER
ncbi:MAG TPA: cation-translocating P-type ATPase [Coriobacteriia bacterium]